MPDFIFRQQRDQGFAAGWILRRKKFSAARTAWGGHQLIFFCGAALEDTGEVLDAFLPGFDGFDGADFVGDVADDGNAELFGFGSGGEIAVARHQRLHLDEIGAVGFEFVDDALAVGRVFERRGAGEAPAPGRPAWGRR